MDGAGGGVVVVVVVVVVGAGALSATVVGVVAAGVAVVMVVVVSSAVVVDVVVVVVTSIAMFVFPLSVSDQESGLSIEVLLGGVTRDGRWALAVIIAGESAGPRNTPPAGPRDMPLAGPRDMPLAWGELLSKKALVVASKATGIAKPKMIHNVRRTRTIHSSAQPHSHQKERRFAPLAMGCGHLECRPLFASL